MVVTPYKETSLSMHYFIPIFNLLNRAFEFRRYLFYKIILDRRVAKFKFLKIL